MTNHGWQERDRPHRLERRIECPDYPALSALLARIAALSERTGIWPDQRFGRNYANLTLYGDDAGGPPDGPSRAFAGAVDDLLAGVEGAR